MKKIKVIEKIYTFENLVHFISDTYFMLRSYGTSKIRFKVSMRPKVRGHYGHPP